MKWFQISWYQYLFYRPRYGFGTLSEMITTILCRIKGHPNGPVWYTLTQYEPDMRCKDCGDEL